MRSLPSEIGELISKYIGKALGGPTFIARSIAVATLSVAKSLLGMFGEGFVTDIECIKESFLRKMKAEADSAVGEAQKKMAEAAEAANRANLPKRKDAIARTEQELAQAKVAKTQAEGEAIRKDAETRRLQAIAEAKARLLEALGKLRQEGGDIFFDRDNLRKILEVGFPPENYKNNSESDSDD